jgi:predicted methyltransferase
MRWWSLVIAIAVAGGCRARDGEMRARDDHAQRQARDDRTAQARDDRAGQRARESAQYDRYRQPEKVIAGLSLAPGMRVADVGAGHGYFTARIAAAVGASGHVVATDVDGAALADVARSPSVETRVVRADEPGLEAAAYDRILVAEVDHYVADRAAWLGKLGRSLAPGGFMIVTNRRSFEEPVLAAARTAHLQATELPLDLPAHFYLRLEPMR